MVFLPDYNRKKAFAAVFGMFCLLIAGVLIINVLPERFALPKATAAGVAIGTFAIISLLTFLVIAIRYEYVLDTEDELIFHNRLTVVTSAGKRRGNEIYHLTADACIIDKKELKKRRKELKSRGAAFIDRAYEGKAFFLLLDYGESVTVLKLSDCGNFREEIRKRIS